MKTCTKCGVSKPLSAFYFEKRSNGYIARCRECVCAAIKAWRKTEEGHASERAKYKRMLDRGFKSKRYGDKTPLERRRQILAVKRWRKNNRERCNREDRLSRQLLRSLAYEKAWPAILEHYGNACLCCGSTKPCFDHIIPLSQQGPNLISNGQPLCRACNSAKGQMTTQTDYRPDQGAWVRSLVALNPWLGEPMPAGRWHLELGGRERLARLKECASRPLALPSDDARSSA